MNFWHTLQKPFLVQAPLDGVSDIVFRQMLVKVGKPDVLFTEFTNTDGIVSEKGSKHVMHRLRFDPQEQPVIAQIWGLNPDNYKKSAEIIRKMGFAGIDINMGCPQHDIVSKGCCSALINNHKLAAKLIAAAQEGAGNLPVSVKTRIGFKSIVTEEWISFLLKQDIAALTVHGRTQKEMSKVPVHWDEIGKAVELRNKISPQTILIGNGDIESYEEAVEKHKQYGVDGVMIGRGIFHNFWVFNKRLKPDEIPFSTKLQTLIDHVTLYTDTWGKEKPYEVLKKFFKVYINDVPNASEMRMKVMEFETPEETIAYAKQLLQLHQDAK